MSDLNYFNIYTPPPPTPPPSLNYHNNILLKDQNNSYFLSLKKPDKFYPTEEELSPTTLFNNFNFQKVENPLENNNIYIEEVRKDFLMNGLDVEEYNNKLELKTTQLIKLSKKKLIKKPIPNECVFCKNNGEPSNVYKNHILKDIWGQIQCPKLQAHVCPICFATGLKAHTLRYCPTNNAKKISKIEKLLK